MSHSIWIRPPLIGLPYGRWTVCKIDIAGTPFSPALGLVRVRCAHMRAIATDSLIRANPTCLNGMDVCPENPCLHHVASFTVAGIASGNNHNWIPVIKTRTLIYNSH